MVRDVRSKSFVVDDGGGSEAKDLWILGWGLLGKEARGEET